MDSIVAMRPVWYPDDSCAVSYASVAEGHAIYGRTPDAWGAYMIEPDGRLVHLFDTPCNSLPAARIR